MYRFRKFIYLCNVEQENIIIMKRLLLIGAAVAVVITLSFVSYTRVSEETPHFGAESFSYEMKTNLKGRVLVAYFMSSGQSIRSWIEKYGLKR